MASLRSINQDDLRNHNLSVVIDTLLRAADPLSRADLAKETGLTKATMSVLVSLLLGGGILEEGEPTGQSLYGRPSIPLVLKAGRICGMGLQVNTDGYGVIVQDINGTTVGERWVDADMSNTDPRKVFASLNELAEEQEARLAELGYMLAGTGLALPGLVTDDMCLFVARNLGWEQLDLKSFDVVKRLDAKADNEANLAALAQIPGYAMQRRGMGMLEPTASFIYLSTDVGIGGALVRDGRVVRGDHGFGGEIGHVSVDMRGPVCRCGRRGCLEVYAGRRSMVGTAGIASGDAAATKDACDAMMALWRQRDSKTVAVVEKALEAMASAIVSMVNMCDVDMVMLGGLWARFEPELIDRVERMVRSQALAYPKVRVRVRMADVVKRPALLGAAESGLRRFVDDPLQFIA
ncbi:ROK family protein [uncultured Bifidobacterium sp.]|uniref:ROK family protein n=1 Tax=uncultured Bifidobacterium sp. TaxID=165187 RepID=UPI00262FB4BF|nr:ROK family protein [uncultured Bifidobacterium sp.]